MRKIIIQDPEVLLLATLANTLKEEYLEEDLAWEGSPFGWLKTKPSRQKGTIAEKLLAGYFAARDFDVVKSPDSQADRIIEGIRTEIKSSTLWKGGFYQFQQLRDQNYEIVICLGISPFDAHCWIIPKDTIMEKWGIAEGLSSQHGGKAGQDTAWLRVIPTNVQEWLSPYGGTLAQATRLFAKLIKG